MWRCFSSELNSKAFISKPLQVDINEKNSVENVWQRMSEKFDFTKEDKINNRDFNEVIWKAIKGTNAVAPAPKRAGFLKVNKAD
jgi:hypothetical protein